MATILSFIDDLKQAAQRMRDLGEAANHPEIKRRYLAVASALDKMAERAEIDVTVENVLRN